MLVWSVLFSIVLRSKSVAMIVSMLVVALDPIVTAKTRYISDPHLVRVRIDDGLDVCTAPWSLLAYQ